MSVIRKVDALVYSLFYVVNTHDVCSDKREQRLVYDAIIMRVMRRKAWEVLLHKFFVFFDKHLCLNWKLCAPVGVCPERLDMFRQVEQSLVATSTRCRVGIIHQILTDWVLTRAVHGFQGVDIKRVRSVFQRLERYLVTPDDLFVNLLFIVCRVAAQHKTRDFVHLAQQGSDDDCCVQNVLELGRFRELLSETLSRHDETGYNASEKYVGTSALHFFLRSCRFFCSEKCLFSRKKKYFDLLF